MLYGKRDFHSVTFLEPVTFLNRMACGIQSFLIILPDVSKVFGFFNFLILF